MGVQRSGLVVLLLAAACSVGSQQIGGGGGGAAAQGGGTATGGGSGAGGGVTTAPDGGLAQATACSVLNARRCDYLVRCGLVADDDVSRRGCLAYLASTWCGPSTWPSRVDPAVGTERYDGVAAANCADVYLTQSCTSFATEPTPCTRIAVAAALPGQSCFDGAPDCIEGVCRGAACPRICQPRGAAAEVCRLDTDCRSGLYCRLSNIASGVGSCTSLGGSMALCDATAPCATGLLCADGKCQAPPPAGQPCLTGSICDDQSFCEAGDCVQRVGTMAACTDDVQCASGLLCLDGKCRSKTVTGAGAECWARQSCAMSQVCVGATGSSEGRCLAPKAEGESCVASGDCEAHLSCRVLDGGLSCGERRDDGTLCSLDRDCRLLSRCARGTCTALPSTGQSCELTRVCLLGPCLVAGADGGALCVEPLGPGERCSRDDECASARCGNGLCLPSCSP